MTDTPAEREDSSIWAKLRRRRVAQWGLAYAAGAWVLLQVLGFVSDSFAWPATVKQLATIVFAVGLPIVVVLGWYHGERGQRRVSTPELAVLTLLLLMGGGLLWLYSQHTVPTTTAATAAKSPPTSVATDARPSVAVLPFENRSREADDAFFVDGIHDDILTQLSKVSALRVISRTSVERFRKTELSAQEIAQQLGVKSILEGGVQRAGDRVRISVQLIDAGTDAHIWAESYDRELIAANVFAIQSELAAAIAGALKTTLTPAEQARARAVPTQNLAAWEAYQIGTQRMENRTTAGLAAAESHFRKAIELDPQFALAWAGLAGTLAMQTVYSGRPKEAGLGDAERAVARALELDPDLAEAWARAGDIAVDRLQLARAERLLRRAIALNPNYASAHHWLSNTLSWLGRRDEALVTAEHAIALDPLSPIINNRLGRQEWTSAGSRTRCSRSGGRSTSIRRCLIRTSISQTYMPSHSADSILRFRGTRRRRVWTQAVPTSSPALPKRSGNSATMRMASDGSQKHWPSVAAHTQTPWPSFERHRRITCALLKVSRTQL